MQNAPIEWYDPFTDTKERKIFTFQEHRIPGLRMFGYHNTSHAIPALSDHYHKNCFEITFLAQGSVQFCVRDRMYDLSGGDLFVTMPDVVHSTGNSPMSLHQMYWFQLRFDDPEHFLYLSSSAASRLIRQLLQLQNPMVVLDSATASLFPAILAAISEDTDLGRIEAAQMLAILLCRVLKAGDSPSIRATPDILKAREYILTHIREVLDMEQLAMVALLSVSRFKQKFKAQIGMSPRSFVNYHKIEAAKEMLRQNASVTEVAMELNFSSSNYFSEVFHRYTSLSPTEYVEQLEKTQAPLI